MHLSQLLGVFMKEYFRTLVENSRIDYLGVLQWVWSRGKRSAQPQLQQGQAVIYNQGIGWGFMDGKSLRQNPKAKGFLARPMPWILS